MKLIAITLMTLFAVGSRLAVAEPVRQNSLEFCEAKYGEWFDKHSPLKDEQRAFDRILTIGACAIAVDTALSFSVSPEEVIVSNCLWQSRFGLLQLPGAGQERREKISEAFTRCLNDAGLKPVVSDPGQLVAADRWARLCQSHIHVNDAGQLGRCWEFGGR